MGPPRVSFFHDSEVSGYYYARYHPMKPMRLLLTHHLLLGYGLYKKMEIYRPHRALSTEMALFHSPEYVDFLSRISPDNVAEFQSQLTRFNVGGEDCPVFDGLYEYCRTYAGGSIDGALKLNNNQCEIAVNWSGGLHHAKKCEASGFCYINDIVLAIIELLKHHPRVLYIDIDIHHGDGVEEAFYVTDRVMTVSFHKYGDMFFPGTGDITDVGTHSGKYYSVNVPLRTGVDDRTFLRLFKPIINKVMEMYKPGAVVLQCGADSLSGDRLGCFNLTLKGHAEAVRFVKSFGLPTMVLGGGGYNIRNVARCWTYETAVVLDQELDEDLPYNDYWEYFGPEFRLHIQPMNIENMNGRDVVERLKQQVFENLRQIGGAPGIQMQQVPPDLYLSEEDEDEADPDVRVSQRDRDKHVQRNDEYYDSDNDQDQAEVH